MYRFSYSQLVKYTANHLALEADPALFMEKSAERTLLWGTPGYAASDKAFRVYLQPFIEQARALVISGAYDGYGRFIEGHDEMSKAELVAHGVAVNPFDAAAEDDAEADEVEAGEDYEDEAEAEAEDDE